MRSIEHARELLRASQRPLALAGAGLSAESGIATFRGAGGLWKNFNPQELATPEAFARNPRLVWEWYAMRRDKGAECKPNPAHHALARLERSNPFFYLLTQNVDGLSQTAGSTRVLEFHGSIWRTKCGSCDYKIEDRNVPTNLDNACPACETGFLRPDVVWFGEALDPAGLLLAQQLASSCDLLFVLGTSAQVYPAASFVPLAARSGAKVIEINPEDTPMSELATVTIRTPVGEALPQILNFEF